MSDIDISGKIGPLFPQIRANAEWKMYSFDTPSYIVWNTVARHLSDKEGWSETEIKDWLQSKSARWALDGKLGDAIREATEAWAKELVS